jgi:hypothetical protein
VFILQTVICVICVICGFLFGFLRVLCVFVVNFYIQRLAPEESPGLTCASTETNKPQSIATDSGLVFGDLSNFNPPTLARLFIKIDFFDAFLLDQLEPVGLVQVSDESIYSRLFDCNCPSYYSSR